MKTAILVLLSIFISHYSYCQCEVDAGTNRNLCPEEIFNNPKLEGEIVSGDIVEISWASQFYEPVLNQFYYASSMLNDTSILEPVIEHHFDRTVKYYLTGKTVDNETCIDSVELNFSDWVFLTIDKVTGKLPNDTIQLWIAAQSNWEHTQYEWSPNFMISDTTVEKPLVWNDITTFYNLTITDSIGCSVTDDVFEVYVNPNSVNESKVEDFNIYPNPTSSTIQVKSLKEIYRMELFDINGNKLKTVNPNYIDLSEFSSGQYFLTTLFTDNTSITKIINKVNKY